MSSANNPFNRFCRAVIRVTEVIVSIILAFLVIDVLWGVFTRFVVNEQSRWTEEVAIYLLIWVSLLGATVTYADNGHLGVDYLVQKWDGRTRRIGQGAVHVIVLLFSLIGLVYGGWQLVKETAQAGQVSAAIGMPMAIVYAAVPVSGILFVLFGIYALLNLPAEDDSGIPREKITDV